jgi:hypothetical protein
MLPVIEFTARTYPWRHTFREREVWVQLMELSQELHAAVQMLRWFQRGVFFSIWEHSDHDQTCCAG